jgi:type I restriction enzyme, S subunit
MSVPKLRFPEFRDAGEWEEKKLGEICNLIRGPFGGSLKKDIFVKDGYAVYEQSHAIHRNLDVFRYYISKEKFTELKRFSVESGDMIMSCSGTMGKFAIIPKGSKSGVINQALLKLTAKKGLDVHFAKTVLELSNNQEQLLSQSAGGAIKNVVSVEQIKELYLCIPSLPEQQKIADCLALIDDRITAETQKLDTLKAHKKGLMQQLFPAEGETLPKLRFPEFRNAGEWEIKEFSKYIVLYRGSSPRPIQNYLSSNSSGVNWIKIGDTKYAKNFIISQVDERITPEGAEKSRKVNVGELILANSMSYGKTYQVAIDGYIYDGWFVLRDYEKYFNKRFLLQLLNSEYMQSQYERFSAGGIVQNISSDIVYKTLLPRTSLKEQQKIANCLSSIDDLITAQTKKIDTLKTHKKGLMQQLFPALEEVKK